MLYAKVAQKEPDSTRCAFSELIEACRSSPLHLRYNLKIRTYLPKFHSTIPLVPFPKSWAVDIGNGPLFQVSAKRERLCSLFRLAVSQSRFYSISVRECAADAGTRNYYMIIRRKTIRFRCIMNDGRLLRVANRLARVLTINSGNFLRKMIRSSHGLLGASRQSK